MNRQYMSYRRIFGQSVCDVIAARREIIAFVDQGVGAVQVSHSLCRAQAVGAVGEHQNFSVFWHEGSEHRFDAI